MPTWSLWGVESHIRGGQMVDADPPLGAYNEQASPTPVGLPVSKVSGDQVIIFFTLETSS